MPDPMNSTEVAIEQRLVGLLSATVALQDIRNSSAGRPVLANPRYVDDLEFVRDHLSQIIDSVRGIR